MDDDVERNQWVINMIEFRFFIFAFDDIFLLILMIKKKQKICVSFTYDFDEL